MRVQSFGAEYIVVKAIACIESTGRYTKKYTSPEILMSHFKYLCWMKCLLVESDKDYFTRHELVGYINVLQRSNLSLKALIMPINMLVKHEFIMVVDPDRFYTRYALTMKCQMFFNDLNDRMKEVLDSPMGIPVWSPDVGL